MSFISSPSPLPVSDGGTGDSNPSLIAGAGIAIGGPWPNQTISATGVAYPEVSTYADLPAAASVPSEIYVVLQSTGVYFINRHPAGFYYSDGVAWSYLAELGENYFNDANLEFFDNADPSKIVKFQLSGLTTGTTRTYNTPDANGTLALTSDIPPTIVQSVTASAPLASTGGANPDISMTSPLPIANGGTNTATPALVAGANIAITSPWPNQTIAFDGVLPVLNGGSGTSTPALSAGANIAITSPWPNQTIAFDGVLPVLNGGSGTSTPALVAGSGISITGAWPNNTITNTAGTGVASVGASWNFDTATGAADPGNKKFRLNNASLASVTAIYLNDTTNENFDISTIASFLASGNRIYIQQKNDATRAALYQLTGAATDNGGWWTVPVVVVDDGGVLFQNNSDCGFVLLLNASAGSGSGTAYTEIIVNLGSADRSGTFDITGLSGLTVDKFVDIQQSSAAIPSKGGARDELEFDSIDIAGYVVDASTIRARWRATGVVVGDYAFAYAVSA